jgi:hypothetical protein
VAINFTKTHAMDIRIRDPMEMSLPPVTLDWTLDFTSRELKQALAYWTSCCGKRRRPVRDDLHPAAMAPFLRHVTLIEVRHLAMGARAYRVRLAGTYVEQVFGPISGQRIDQVLPPPISVRWQKCFDTVCEAERPLRLTGRVGFEDKSWLTGEVFLAPLGDEARPISMLFAAFVWHQDPQQFASERSMSRAP